ncbi:tegument protein UL43 [Saimiriine betaherpesvirus 4]|uniref:Tegument protein UL43 n=1 Tax=Saimiriine betaherpesvirus 4 TaxID=1535247 RepID=G8XSV7_9BETA|nr:tegument protein UL43 [Saimiriine betaherpesvirus 4]AEV80903.1 tegument protein UL43 [Saimiriine betaherpesvirus 4]
MEPEEASCDLIRLTFQLSVENGAPRNLLSLVRMHHGTKLSLPWPVQWYFTYYDFQRKGSHRALSIKGIFKNYLCCDKFAVPVGVVGPDEGVESASLVVIIGEKGCLYVYSYQEDAIYLVSRQGFCHLIEVGLYQYPPLRDELSPDITLSDSSLSEFLTASDLVSCWRLCRKYEGHVYAWNCEGRTVSLTVCGDHAAEDRVLHNEWLQETGSVNVINIFEATTWINHAWLHVPILVNESGVVFGVDVENSRTYYLAPNLATFFKVAFLRFRNTYRFTNGCFGKTVRSLSALAPTECPRGLFCRRLKKTVKRSWFSRNSSS